MTTKKSPDFNIVTVLLAENHFTRSHQVHLKHKETLQKSELNVVSGPKRDENNISQVSLELNFNLSFQGVKEVECRIVYVGLFESSEEVSDDQLEQFCYINAPAMLFPFVREHLSNLCQKAALGTIILQSENFVQGYHDLKKKKKDQNN